MSEKKQVTLLRSWQSSPEKFFREALKVEMLTFQQIEALNEVAMLVACKRKLGESKVNPRIILSLDEMKYAKKIGISIMAGKGVGKSFFGGGLILWFLSCFPDCVIPCTAPSAHQLRDVLWKNAASLLGKSIIKDWHTLQNDKIYYTAKGGKEWFAIARTCNPKASLDAQANTLQGFHAKHMMIVIDEASGVGEPVFDKLESTLTEPCNFILMLFNPNKSTGFAIGSHVGIGASDWIRLRWNAEESTLVTKESIERYARKYGKDSNFYRVNVLGLPPKSDKDTLIPYEWVEAAINRDIEPMDTDLLVAGFDVGAGGDSSVLAFRLGPKVYNMETNDTPDSELLTNWSMAHILTREPSYVMVDKIGVGWGIEGNLRARIDSSATQIVGVNAGEMPSLDDKFYCLRDELWWRLRDQFEHGTISIPDDEELKGELTTIKYDQKAKGRHGFVIKVEDKRSMIARGLRSPNKADALCMTEYFATESLRKMNSHTQQNWRKNQQSISYRTV